MTMSRVLLVLLQLCSLQLMVVAMPTCKLRANLVQKTHHQLRDLGGAFPVHCLRYNVNISFPDSAFPAATANQLQCRRALWVVHESLLGMQQLMFQNDGPPTGEGGIAWDNGKLNTFRILQDRVLEEGAGCASTDTGPDVLTPYFTNVTSVVQQQDSAACGWMALRRDVLSVLKTALQQHHSCFIH